MQNRLDQTNVTVENLKKQINGKCFKIKKVNEYKPKQSI